MSSLSNRMFKSKPSEWDRRAFGWEVRGNPSRKLRKIQPNHDLVPYGITAGFFSLHLALMDRITHMTTLAWSSVRTWTSLFVVQQHFEPTRVRSASRLKFDRGGIGESLRLCSEAWPGEATHVKVESLSNSDFRTKRNGFWFGLLLEASWMIWPKSSRWRRSWEAGEMIEYRDESWFE